MQKKVLKNIRQYHTCWFRDEFYHHLLAAYSFFGVPAEYVVCNYIIDVEPYELGKDIVYSEHEILTDGEFRALTGARPRSLRPDDLWKRIITCIRSEFPLIIGQDAFYLPFRRKQFNKKHSDNFVLIYGVDPQKEIVYLSGDTGTTLFNFEEMALPFSTVKAAFDGYCARHENDAVTAVMVEPVENVSLSRKSDVLNKLKESFFNRNYAQYASFYRMFLDRPWTLEDLKKWDAFTIKYTNFFCILATQCGYIFGSLRRSEAMAGAGHSALRFLEIYKQALAEENPELVSGEEGSRLATDIEERLKYMNRMKTAAPVVAG